MWWPVQPKRRNQWNCFLSDRLTSFHLFNSPHPPSHLLPHASFLNVSVPFAYLLVHRQSPISPQKDAPGVNQHPPSPNCLVLREGEKTTWLPLRQGPPWSHSDPLRSQRSNLPAFLNDMTIIIINRSMTLPILAIYTCIQPPLIVINREIYMTMIHRFSPVITNNIYKYELTLANNHQ